MLYGSHFLSYKESTRVFAALYICNAMSYTAVSLCKITSYLVLKVNMYIVHNAQFILILFKIYKQNRTEILFGLKHYKLIVTTIHNIQNIYFTHAFKVLLI